MGYIAEKQIIGSLLMDFKEVMPKIYNVITTEMFESELLARIYTEFQRGYDNGYEVNIVVLEQNLRNEKYLPGMLLDEIKECMNETVTSSTVDSYADVVVKDFRTKKAIQIISEVKFTPNNINSQIGEILRKLENLKEDKTTRTKILPQIVEENKNNYFCDKKQNKIFVGFSKLDDCLGGLEGGDVIVIGARPAVGKSAFVTQITSNLAKQEKRIGFYNLEMQEAQVYERFVVSESGIGLTRLRRAIKFLGDEKERFDRANEVLETRDSIVLTTGSKSVGEIRSEVKHMGYDIIIIDYLQLLKSDITYRGNRTAEVGAISKAIKGLAMELNIPIIALSQMNRLSEGKETKEPTMAELREAGDIEQDASVVMLLWNASSNDKAKKGIKVEKNRQGTTEKFVMKFNGDLMRFEETDECIDNISRKESRRLSPFDKKDKNEFVQIENDTPFGF